jgi:hypothetical protein
MHALVDGACEEYFLLCLILEKTSATSNWLLPLVWMKPFYLTQHRIPIQSPIMIVFGSVQQNFAFNLELSNSIKYFDYIEQNACPS